MCIVLVLCGNWLDFSQEAAKPITNIIPFGFLFSLNGKLSMIVV